MVTLFQLISMLWILCFHRSFPYSGRFPQVGAKSLSAKNIFLPCSLFKRLPELNPPHKTAPIVSKPALNTPNCAYITHFLPENTKWTQKNPSGIVSIPDGFVGLSIKLWYKGRMQGWVGASQTSPLLISQQILSLILSFTCGHRETRKKFYPLTEYLLTFTINYTQCILKIQKKQNKKNSPTISDWWVYG